VDKILESALYRAGEVVRAARLRSGLTLAELGDQTGYSAAQVSRYERGVTPLRDVAVLHLFARALAISPEELGLAGSGPGTGAERSRFAAVSGVPSLVVTSRVADEHRGRDDDVRRRQLLAALGAVAAGAAGGRADAAVQPADPAGAQVGELMVSRVRDAMLGLAPVPARVSAAAVRAGLDGALADFRDSRYGRLSVTLPRLIGAGHMLAAGSPDPGQRDALLAGIYTLTTRMLIKLDDQQLGWMAADRARVLASAGGNPLAVGEAARNLAVLARKAGWHQQATSIALSAAASPLLAGSGSRLAAERGLLIQSAAYTAARAGDRDGMRELTDQAASIAGPPGGQVLLRDHGGFSPATVELHRVSAENYAGDPGAAVAAALRIVPASLPTTERRARYWTDTARAYANWGRREDCVNALLAAEREAPEEAHARPAVRDLVSGLLVTGRTGPELRGLATRCGIT
jgi:transcriptional regulator with XRE-family HTH domain